MKFQNIILPVILLSVCYHVHLKSNNYKKEQANLSEFDEWMGIYLDKNRIKYYNRTDIGHRMKKLESLVNQKFH